MAKVRKAARGKHRWVGLEFESESLSRDEVGEKLKVMLGLINFRLYDCKSQSDSTIAIIKVPLPNYALAREAILNAAGVESLTSSGKIRLVRERLGLPRPVRKR